MNAEILKSAGIDYDSGVKRFVGRANLYEKMLSRFPSDTTIQKIHAAFLAGDNALLFSGAHEFKGMCGNIGLTSLYTAADALVRLLRGGAFTKEDLNSAYTSLDTEYDKILKAVTAAMEA